MNELLYLIPKKEINDNGFLIENVDKEKKRLIYAEDLNISSGEFYASQQAGYKELLKFKVYKAEYKGEQYAEHDNKTYKIIRKYKLKGDFLELTLERFINGNV